MNQAELIRCLKEYAAKAGLSQESLGHAIGVTFCTINNWFNGKHQKMHKATENAVRLFLRERGELK